GGCPVPDEFVRSSCCLIPETLRIVYRIGCPAGERRLPSNHASAMKNARFFLTYLLVRVLVMGALLGLVAGDGKPVAAAAKPIAIVIDGEEVPSDVAPRIVAGRTLVPLRVISEHLGAVVVWNQTDKSVTVTAGGRNILLHIDNKQAS